MGTKWQKLKALHDRLLHFWIAGSLAGGIVAYTVMITAKLVWGLPDYDWWRIALGPVVGLGFPMCAFWFAARLDLREAHRREELE
jgi:hypothetical protein